MKPLVTSFLALTLTATGVRAQQVADSAFHYADLEPAFEAETGPRVCIDSGHHNFHTLDGRYLAFGTLLRDDGYRVRGHAGAFSPESLGDCDVMVISNATAEANAENWSYPHPSAFSADEITALVGWVRDGGSLLLIVDHSPMPGASGDPGKLADHPILEGRNSPETVTSVTTFTGHAFYPSANMKPLLVLSADAMGVAPLRMNLPETETDEGPRFAVGGWLQGGAARLGQGRVVVLGEAAMCTAQLAGPQRAPIGMNNPLAPQNAQFCLNVVHWLSGLLGD
jgi:hypothetical protein